jgi:hypothetical protein
MPALKDFSLLVALAMASCLGFNEARAAEASPVPAAAEAAPQVLAPDQVRIAADLDSHYLVPGTSGLSGAKGFGDSADSTAIRSSVRNGDVLEFRVTSLYYADSDGGPQREVDSTVRYEKSGDDWRLLDVQMNGTRVVAAGNGRKGSDC